MDFPEAASVLSELCTFHPKNDSFVYTSPKEYPNAFFKLNHNANLDTKKLLSLRLNHKTQIKFTSPLQQYLFTCFFPDSNLLKNFKSKGEEILVKSQESAEKRKEFQSRDAGCMYLMCLLMVYKINGEKTRNFRRS